MKRIVIFNEFLLALFCLFLAGTSSAQDSGVSAARDAPGSKAPSPPVISSGTLGTATFLSSAGQVGNGNASAWVAAFSTTVNLTGSAQCMELRYSGEVAVDSSYLPLSAKFRATVDGVIVNGGSYNGQFFDAIDSAVYTIAAMNWWECNLAAGPHTVMVLFKPVYSGDAAYVRNRTLIIEYSQ